MKLFLLLTITLFSGRSHCFHRTLSPDAVPEISYEDLKKMNVSCHPRDTCETARIGDSPGMSLFYACSCDRLCSKLGTCCIDSPHKDTLSPTVKPRCRAVEDNATPQGFYMVDRCLIDGKFNPIWENLCEEEWKGEDNIIKIAPVTSLFTSMTYKNYFCFRCHETTEEFLFWNVELRSYQNGSGVVAGNGNLGVVYDRDNETWLANGGNGTSIPVSLSFKPPVKIGSLAARCEPDMISNCSDSSVDGGTCNAYTAMVYIKRDDKVLKYKNAHCALCNSESLENMVCEHREMIAQAQIKTFSFMHLLDINRSSGDKVGKVKKCEENFIWDPYAKRCRKTACAIPGYTIKDGQCIPP